MASQTKATQHRNEAERILAALDRAGLGTFQGLSADLPQWMFYVEVGGTVAPEVLNSKITKVETLSRELLSLYQWPEVETDQRHLVWRGIRSVDGAWRPVGPDWSPEPGEVLIPPNAPDAVPPVIDVRAPALRILEAIAALRKAIEKGDATTAATAAAAAIGLVTMIAAHVRSGDLRLAGQGKRNGSAKGTAQEHGDQRAAHSQWRRRNAELAPQIPSERERAKKVAAEFGADVNTVRKHLRRNAGKK